MAELEFHCTLRAENGYRFWKGASFARSMRLVSAPYWKGYYVGTMGCCGRMCWPCSLRQDVSVRVTRLNCWRGCFHLSGAELRQLVSYSAKLDMYWPTLLTFLVYRAASRTRSCRAGLYWSLCCFLCWWLPGMRFSEPPAAPQRMFNDVLIDGLESVRQQPCSAAGSLQSKHPRR